jgi:hypothetical protein
VNLNQIVLDKIKELGPTKSAAYFGVSVPTVYSWKKKSAPIEAVQKVMDEQKDAPDEMLRVRGPDVNIKKQKAPPFRPNPDPVQELKKAMKHQGAQPSELGDPIIIASVRKAADVTKTFVESKVDILAKQVEQRLNRIEMAILNGNTTELRQFVMTRTDPDKNTPLTSNIFPFRNPESGIKVDSAAELLEPASRAPEGKSWNEGKQAGRPDWNAPAGQGTPRNPGSDWNRELPPKQEE